MSAGSARRVSFGAWVEGVARHIDDPVQRLRFMRVAAPCGAPAPASRNRLRAMLFPAAVVVFVFLLLTGAATFLRLAMPVRAASSVAPAANVKAQK